MDKEDDSVKKSETPIESRTEIANATANDSQSDDKNESKSIPFYEKIIKMIATPVFANRNDNQLRERQSVATTDDTTEQNSVNDKKSVKESAIIDSNIDKKKTSTEKIKTESKPDFKSSSVGSISESKSESSILSDNGLDEKRSLSSIKLDEVEMWSSDSVVFLICIVFVLILVLFILYGVCFWIYNYLNGLDWKLGQESNVQFNFHIFFMSLALCQFGIGILTHRVFRGFSIGALNCMHGLLTLVTSAVALVGAYFAIQAVNSMRLNHFCTTHSWFGLISLILITTQWFSGFVIFVFPSFVIALQTILIPSHSYIGRATFAITCGTAIIGISDKLLLFDLIEAKESEINNQTERLIVRNATKVSEDIEMKQSWNVPKETLLCNVIAIAILVYFLLVVFISGNYNYRRRPLPEVLDMSTILVKYTSESLQQ